MTDKMKRDLSHLWMEFERGNNEALAALLAEEPKPTTPAEATLFGLHALDVDQPAKSVEYLQRAIALEPQNVVARLHLALAVYRIGDPAASATTLRSVPLFPHTGFLLRFLHLFWPLRFSTSLGHPVTDSGPAPVGRDPLDAPFRALEPRLAEIEKESMEPPAGESLGGEVSRHHRELTTAEGKEARSARTLSDRYLKRGISAFLSGDRPLALHCFTRARLLRPANESAAAHFAWVSLLVGEPEQAREAMEPVLEARLAEYEKSRLKEALPTPDALVCYAWCLHEAGEHRDALRVLALVEPEGPEDFGAHFVAGVCWLMLGNREMADRLLKVALSTYFIDTWEQIVRPFVTRTIDWMGDGAPKAPENAKA